MSDSDLNAKIRSLNTRQREIFDVVFTWGKHSVQSRNSDMIAKPEPLRIFLTGKGGAGKSHLLKCMYHSLTKLLSHKGGETEKSKGFVISSNRRCCN